MEAQQGFPFKAQPMTIVAYQIDCENIVDLNDPDTLNLLGITVDELASSWEDLATLEQEPPTWKIASQLQSQGISGIKCRSFAPGCKEQNHNLVLWQWSDSPPHSVRVIDDFKRLVKSKDL